MKNLVVVLGCFFVINAHAQTLFTYGKNSVSKEEFIQAFLKNKPENVNETDALKEYLELYIRFKLKVQAAYDLKIDTLPNQKADIETFRHQVENGFLTDSSSFRALIDEAFERSQKDIRLSYILVPFSEQGKDDAETTALKKTTEALDKIKSGTAFSSVAANYSADTAAKRNGGDLGYITLFTLPYALENIAYQLKTGDVSAPVKTKAGYIILKKTEERAAVGKIIIAQILIAYDKSGGADERLHRKRLADSLYQAVSSGSSFDTLAMQFSNDQASFANGGRLAEFGVGIYDPVFESKAFALKKDGEISPPFETGFGFHILKRISATPVETNRQMAENFLKSVISEDARNKSAMDVQENKMLKQVSIKTEPYDEKQLWKITEDYIKTESFQPTAAFGLNKILFRFPKKNVEITEWLRYARTWSVNDNGNTDFPGLMTSFKRFTSANYYRTHLEDFNPAFKKQLKEFADGNVLFEVMEREVWNKAASDIKGLRKYYDENKNKYTWESSASAIMLTVSDRELAEKTIAQLKAKPGLWRQLSETSQGRIVADSSRFEISQLSTDPNLKENSFTPILNNDIDQTVTFSYIIKLHPAGSIRNFDEARGMVISDYQQVVEDQWIAQLKKKYPVVVNQQAWREVQR